MSLQGYATAVNQTNEVIAAYASSPYQPEASDPAPWVVFGSFTVPVAIKARLCVSGYNAGAAVLSVAVFAPAKLDGSLVVISSATETEVLSQAFDLVPGVVYEMAAQYLGATSVGAIRTASLRSL